MEISKNVVAAIGIVALVFLQLGAWYLGHDGQVTALCSAGIGALIGYITGIELKFKKEEDA